MRESAVCINTASLEKLRTLEPFARLPGEEIRRLFENGGVLRLRRYDAGEVIIEEGEYDSWTFFLISGEVVVASQGRQLASITDLGEVFGEWGPVRGQPRTARVEAVSDTLCLAIDLSLLDHLQSEDPAREALLAFFGRIIDCRFLSVNSDLVSARQSLAVSKATISNLQAEKEEFRTAMEAARSDLAREKEKQVQYDNFLEFKGLSTEFRDFTDLAQSGDIVGSEFEFADLVGEDDM